jgi:glycerol-3-phosphate acyltransferase PlsY
MRFKGGKGLASYGGLILGVSPWMFLILLTLGLIAMFVANYSVVLLIPASILFPIMGGIRFQSLGFFLIALGISTLTLFQFRGNFRKIRQGTELKLRDYIKNHLR